MAKKLLKKKTEREGERGGASGGWVLWYVMVEVIDVGWRDHGHGRGHEHRQICAELEVQT